MSAFSAIVIKLYPNKVGNITSWSETALGIGYIIGPVFGGYLYDIGGFHLPFMAIGVSNLFFAFIMLMALPQQETNTDRIEKYRNISTAQIILEVCVNQTK